MAEAAVLTLKAYRERYAPGVADRQARRDLNELVKLG
jgi:hypothetical protein